MPPSHNHCNRWQLQLSRWLSPQFLGHRQTVASLFFIMGWNPVEKLGQRAGRGHINNKNGVLSRNSHPACCSLSFAKYLLWDIYFTLLKMKLNPDGLYLSLRCDRWTLSHIIWPCILLSYTAFILDSFWGLCLISTHMPNAWGFRDGNFQAWCDGCSTIRPGLM